MLEPEGTKTILGLTAQEIHALGYGLMEGVKFWKRREIPFDEIDTLGLSPEWRADIKAKYHYYRLGFDLPEDAALVVLLGYFLVNHFDKVAAGVAAVYGVI